ncbi:MAG: hypothetical protein QOE03_3034 [Micromonosporaceae bacterium]|nr:hypothetical protein [Micromonosporaceae bacterium]
MTVPGRWTPRRALIAVTAGLAALAVGAGSMALIKATSHPDRSISTLPTSPGPRGSGPSVSPGPSPPPDAATLPPATVPGTGGQPVGWWRPRGVLTWQWQLQGKPDLNLPVQVYDIDAVESSAGDVAALHTAGRRAICYLNAGAYEDFRPDRARYPAAVRGRPLDGWPHERWLDIRRWDVLEPILRDRIATCRRKGFDGVEPDNVDGFANGSGFGLTAEDQLTFNRRVADLAHSYGLAVGLKNDVEQAASLAPWFDYAVNEECVEHDECDLLRVFTAVAKPVFHVEYALAVDRFCAATRRLGFSSMRKKVDLDAWRQPC